MYIFIKIVCFTGVVMAFRNVKGICLKTNNDEERFILSDSFSIYKNGSDIPKVYEWSEISRIAEMRSNIIIYKGNQAFKIPKACFDSDTTYLSAIALIEGVCAEYSIPYSHLPRLLVTKNKYIDSQFPDKAFIASGFLDEKELTSINNSLHNTLRAKLIFLLSLIVSILTFILLTNKIEVEFELIPMFMIISITAAAVFATLFLFIQYCIIKSSTHKTAKSDPAYNFQITYAISKAGFLETESFLFSKSNYISWSNADNYIDTGKAIVVLKGSTPLLKLPKRLFTRHEIKNILMLIDDSISQ